MKFILSFFFLLLLLSCNSKELNPLEKALSSDNIKIKRVTDHLEQHDVQILFSEVIEDEGQMSFNDFSFQVDADDYFYPASSVKFPIAVLALEKLNKNKVLTIDTPFNIEDDTLITTFRDEINKLFAVSDNLAYSRLFEYLGQDYITEQLEQRGIRSRISHRFSVSNPYDIQTKPIHFYSNNSIVYTSKPMVSDTIKHLTFKGIKKGKGHIDNDTLVNQSMDFSLKNYLPLQSLHNLMKQVIFPEAFEASKRFELSESDRVFLLKSMQNLPYEVGYDREEFYDSYVKFLVFGDSKTPIPDEIKIYNKVGYAYGTLTDCAYIVNAKTNKSYIISAMLLVNKNQIFNDGVRQLIQYP